MFFFKSSVENGFCDNCSNLIMWIISVSMELSLECMFAFKTLKHSMYIYTFDEQAIYHKKGFNYVVIKK